MSCNPILIGASSSDSLAFSYDLYNKGLHSAAFRNAIDRAHGNTKWLALIDADEFILPMQDCSIPECLNRHFSHASEVYINWRNFGTSGITLAQGQPILFQLTRASLPTHSHNAIGKCIVRPEAVDRSSLETPHFCALHPGHQCVNGQAEPMSFRGIDLPTDGKHYDQFRALITTSLEMKPFIAL